MQRKRKRKKIKTSVKRKRKKRIETSWTRKWRTLRELKTKQIDHYITISVLICPLSCFSQRL